MVGRRLTTEILLSYSSDRPDFDISISEVDERCAVAAVRAVSSTQPGYLSERRTAYIVVICHNLLMWVISTFTPETARRGVLRDRRKRA